MNIFEKRKALLQEKFLKVLSEAVENNDDFSENLYGDGSQEDHFENIIKNHDDARSHHKELDKALKSFENNNEVPEEIKDSFEALKSHHEENSKDHEDYDFWNNALNNIKSAKEQRLNEEVLIEKTHEDVFALLHKHKDKHSKKHRDHIDNILNHFGKKIYGGSDDKSVSKRKPVLKSGNKKYLSNNRPYSSSSMMYREERNYSESGKTRSEGTDPYEMRMTLRLNHLMGNKVDMSDLEEKHLDAISKIKNKADLHYHTASADHSAHKFANTLKEQGIGPDDIKDIRHVGGSPGVEIAKMAKDHGIKHDGSHSWEHENKLMPQAHPHDMAIATHDGRIIGASLKNSGGAFAGITHEQMHNLLHKHKKDENSHSKLKEFEQSRIDKTNTLMKAHGFDPTIKNKKGKELKPGDRGYYKNKEMSIDRFLEEHGHKPEVKSTLDSIRDEHRNNLNNHVMDLFNNHDTKTQRQILKHITRSDDVLHKDLDYHLISSNEVGKAQVKSTYDKGNLNDDHILDHTKDHPHFAEHKDKYNLKPVPSWRNHPVVKKIDEAKSFKVLNKVNKKNINTSINFHADDEDDYLLAQDHYTDTKHVRSHSNQSLHPKHTDKVITNKKTRKAVSTSRTNETAVKHKEQLDDHSKKDLDYHIKNHPDFKEKIHGKLLPKWKEHSSSQEVQKRFKLSHDGITHHHQDAIKDPKRSNPDTLEKRTDIHDENTKAAVGHFMKVVDNTVAKARAKKAAAVSESSNVIKRFVLKNKLDLL